MSTGDDPSLSQDDSNLVLLSQLAGGGASKQNEFGEDGLLCKDEPDIESSHDKTKLSDCRNMIHGKKILIDRRVSPERNIGTRSVKQARPPTATAQTKSWFTETNRSFQDQDKVFNVGKEKE